MTDDFVKKETSHQNDYSQLDKTLQEYFIDKPDFSTRVKANHAIKRTLDILLGTAGLIISAPIIATMGLMTIYDSGSPAFFKQERIGYRGNHINIYKIRVMHNGTEEKMLNGEFKLSDIYGSCEYNPLIYTRLGKFLDFTHLNELPQLWNVVKGNMSIVGNRPMTATSMDEMIDHDNMLSRFDSKPGLFGYAQSRPRPVDISQVIGDELNYSKIYTTGNVVLEDFRVLGYTVKMYISMLLQKKSKIPEAATQSI